MHWGDADSAQSAMKLPTTLSMHSLTTIRTWEVLMTILKPQPLECAPGLQLPPSGHAALRGNLRSTQYVLAGNPCASVLGTRLSSGECTC